MPIPVNGGAPPVVVTPPVTPPTTPGPRKVRHTNPAVTLTNASGRVLSLTGTGYAGVAVLPGPSGVGLAPTELFSAVVPDGIGSVYTGSRISDREVFLPLMVGATDYVSLRDNRRTLEAIVADGPVRVSFRQPDSGATRTVEAYYTGGLEGDYGTDVAGRDWQTVGLTFRCLDPLAYGDQASQTWSVTGVARPFLSTTSAFFPVLLGDSLVGGVRVLRNAGDLDAWPVTVITGPGESLMLSNLTTGKSINLAGEITVPITIDTRRGVADVYDAAGEQWSRVGLGSSLWPLVPGENRVQVSLTGATSASSVSMTWQPPYRSLH